MIRTRLCPILVLLILFVTIACSGPRHRHSQRPKLSEAMEKASDDHKGERRIHTGEPSTPWPYDPPPLPQTHPPVRKKQAATASDANASHKKENHYTNVVGLSAGYGMIYGDDVHQVNHLDLSFGFYAKEKERLEAFIGYGYALIDESAELDQSVDDAWLVNLGVRLKLFTTPRHTFLGHYFSFGLSYSELFWTYENDIQVDDRTISSDRLQGVELFAGIGLNLTQTEHFQLGLEVLPSITLWEEETHQGFSNDVFGSFYMIKLRLTLSML